MAIYSKKAAAEKQKALKQSEERFRALIQHSADAIQLISADGKILYSSDSVERVLGYKPEEIQGDGPAQHLHPDDFPRFMERFTALLQKPGGQDTLEYRVRHKNGSWAWIEATGSNYLHDPQIQAIVGNFRNITQRKQIEERQRLLNEASEKLVTSLDHQITLQEIAQLLVPSMADYCRIALLDNQGQIKEIAVNHIEPEKIALVRELYEQYKDRESSTYGLNSLLETGQPELISAVTPEVVAPSAQENPAMLPIINALGLTSYMGTPLIARERVTGAITFSSVQPDRRYTQEDLAFAQELARRIALMLDNARLYQEAQKAISIRDDFISIASHELRTPVTSLKLYVQVLQKQLARLGEENVAYSLTKMDAQLNKLTLLIKDLLNVTRIELGRLDFQEDLFDLNEVVKETVEQIQPTTRKHFIRVEGQAHQPTWGDKDRIGQVLTNLLTNAIKYSPQADTIIVQVTSTQDTAIVSVQDFGIGIEKEHIQSIFDRFYRVTDPDEKIFPGLGIGLYISHEIIKRHGGTLLVESKKGYGSVFSFTLPYKSSTLSPRDTDTPGRM
ncbi:MAG TPA: PAS domain-containing sensor histidine kinase [Ktedonobacteraceae bacterium]